MAKPTEFPPAATFDPVQDEIDATQAEVGSLFSIQGPDFDGVSWSIHRMRTKAEMVADPQGGKKEWVLDMTGALTGSELLDAIGGGTFQFLGYVPRLDRGGVSLRHNKTITLAGPRKNFGAPAAVVGNPAGPVAAPSSDPITRLLERMDERLARLEAAESGSGGLTGLVQSLAALDALRARNTPPPAPAGGGIKELVESLALMDKIRGGAKGGSDLELGNMLLDGIRQGIMIGQERDPATGDPDKSPDYSPLISKAIDAVAAFMASRRRPGPPPGPAREPSSATVIPDTTPPAAPAPPPPAAAENPAEVAMFARWKTTVAALYRAMVSRVEPEEFAMSLEHMLPPDEIEQLRNTPLDDVMGFLAPVLGDFPDLKSEQGKAYLGAVLKVLREGPADDESEGPE